MKKILIIEDSRVFSRALTICFQDAGYSTVAASTGEDGLRAAKQDHPDLILLDMFLPRLDGMMVLRMLNGDPSTRGIPVLILSGNVKSEDIEQAKQLGVVGYHVKDSMPAERLLVEVRGIIGQGDRVSA